MSGVFIVTGKLGSGKTLVSVGIMRDALLQGRKVATNVDLWLEHLLPWQRKNSVVYKLPDKLSMDNFDVIGTGWPEDNDGDIDEEMNGVLVIDEGGLALNSRDYREEGRKDFIKWGIHSRKKGWDLYIVIQHIEALDKQVRDLFGEHVVICSRLDKMRIPMFGWLLQLVGFKGTMGKIHKATCRYGQQHQAVKTWVKWFQGKDLYQAFNTRQTYDPNDGTGVFQYLSPWHIKGRFHSRWEESYEGFKEFYRLYALQKVGKLSIFFSAALLGGWVHASFVNPEVMTVEAAQTPVAVIEPVQPLTFEEIEEVEDFIEANIDPWDYAYISTYVGNSKSGFGKYKFRSAGLSIQIPAEFAMIPISPCSVILKGAEKVYQLYCRKL